MNKNKLRYFVGNFLMYLGMIGLSYISIELLIKGNILAGIISSIVVLIMIFLDINGNYLNANRLKIK